MTGHAIRVSHVGRDVTRSRRFRLGAGALVAGIAVGAFATAAANQNDPVVPNTPGGTNEPASFSPASYSPGQSSVTDPSR